MKITLNFPEILMQESDYAFVFVITDPHTLLHYHVLHEFDASSVNYPQLGARFSKKAAIPSDDSGLSHRVASAAIVCRTVVSVTVGAS